MSATEDLTFEVTSNPLAALFGTSTCLVGVERDEDTALKLYVGARYRGVYVVVAPGECADRLEALWNGTSGHLFVTPCPAAEHLLCDRVAEARRSTGGGGA